MPILLTTVNLRKILTDDESLLICRGISNAAKECNLINVISSGTIPLDQYPSLFSSYFHQRGR